MDFDFWRLRRFHSQKLDFYVPRALKSKNRKAQQPTTEGNKQQTTSHSLLQESVLLHSVATMSSNLKKKPSAAVNRRTWDKEEYEKKAQARQEAADRVDDGKPHQPRKRKLPGETNHGTDGLADDSDEDKEEFQPAQAGAAGPEGSKRAFLKARERKVDIDSKIGSTEMVSAEVAATTSTSQSATRDEASDKSSGVVKTGIGWHCKVCDCFLKDSHTYLDHINGRKHQRNLGFSMRVERSTTGQVTDVLKRLVEEKEKKKRVSSIMEEEEDFDEMVRAKDEALKKQREERRKQRKERKQKLKQEEQTPKEEEEEVVVEGIDPAMAAMMGFSGFGGSGKNG